MRQDQRAQIMENFIHDENLKLFRKRLARRRRLDDDRMLNQQAHRGRGSEDLGLFGPDVCVR